MLHQRCFDLAQLDSVTSYLNLIVHAPEEFDVAAPKIFRPIAGAV
jgi:hypothetical protein